MRDVLVYVDQFKAWTPGVGYAARLSALLQGSLTGAYVYPSPAFMMPPYGSPALLTAILEHARRVETEARETEAAFVSWAGGLGVKHAAWQMAEGYVPDVLAHIGNWHDLLVLECNAEAPWGAPPDLARLVLHAGLPCIVVPPDVRHEVKLDCIVLAWNGAPEAVRAIHSAIPLLKRARRVVLVGGTPRDPYQEIGWKPVIDLVVHLKRHGIMVEREAIGADDAHVGPALLEVTTRCKADLMVMGAYGRSRFSEWMFGGATRHLLACTDVPLFMRH